MKMTARERVEEAGFENVIILDNYSYDDAIVGVTECGRAVYDFDLMVEWLMKTEGFTREESVEWIDYNTIRALGYAGDSSPLIMYRFESAGSSTDVAPVVHGRWNSNQDGFWRKEILICSNCGTRNALNYEFNYCQNCGAKMDGKENE